MQLATAAIMKPLHLKPADLVYLAVFSRIYIAVQGGAISLRAPPGALVPAPAKIQPTSHHRTPPPGSAFRPPRQPITAAAHPPPPLANIPPALASAPHLSPLLCGFERAHWFGIRVNKQYGPPAAAHSALPAADCRLCVGAPSDGGDWRDGQRQDNPDLSNPGGGWLCRQRHHRSDAASTRGGC